MTTQPGPNLTALLNDVHTAGGDLCAAVTGAFRDTVNTMFTEAVRDEVLGRWNDEHAGKSLVAWLSDDGTIACCREMSSAEAVKLANHSPRQFLIVATWPEAS